eukprot:9033216-Pyramimonas_sp.AAC.1
MVVGRLLAEKSGGDRVIGLIAMPCRVWSLAREPCAREWSASLTASWDAAIAGNSALREAYLRALESEVAVQGRRSVRPFLTSRVFTIASSGRGSFLLL